MNTYRFYYWTEAPNSVPVNFREVEANSYALAWFEIRLEFLSPYKSPSLYENPI